jgi:hypothetical protein
VAADTEKLSGPAIIKREDPTRLRREDPTSTVHVQTN